jgi:hypothetical protein
MLCTALWCRRSRIHRYVAAPSISVLYLGQGEACDVCPEEEEEVAHLHVAGEPLHHLLLLLPLRLQHTTRSQQVTWTFLYYTVEKMCR